MTKRRLASYGLNLVGVVLLYALISLAFAGQLFGKSTTYIQGICTTACYTIIMVTSLNLVVGFMGEFSMGHAGFVSVGAYVSAIVSGALAGHGLSDLGLLLVAILAGGLAAGLMGVAVGIPALRLRGDYLAIVTMAFAEIIRRAKLSASHTVGKQELSVREHMAAILRRLRDVRFIEFYDLFDATAGVAMVVVHFLALLELAKETLIEITQVESGAPIYIRLTRNNN